MNKIIVAFLLSIASLSAIAQTNSRSVDQCLSENTTVEERSTLATWIFFVLGSNPNVKNYLKPEAAEAKAENAKKVGAIFTRLMSESCAAPLREAMQQGGPKATAAGFENIGRLAMTELMGLGDVNKNFSEIQKHMDLEKIVKALFAPNETKK